MKNSKLVTTMLDSHAETIRLIRSGTLEDAQAALERTQSGIEIDQWEACLADGWTIAELDDAFERRFHVRFPRP